MQACIQPVYTWSHSALFSGKAGRLTLLIELHGMHPATKENAKSRLAAREIELDLWLEPHVRLIDCVGARFTEDGGGRTLKCELGALQTGRHKMLALELGLDAMPSGVNEAVWLQWRYRQPAGSRRRELPMHKLAVQHSGHTRVLSEPGSFYVEKNAELLKVGRLMAELLSPENKLSYDRVIERIQRQGDRLLLMALRSGDGMLLREAEWLYRQGRKEEAETIFANSGAI